MIKGNKKRIFKKKNVLFVFSVLVCVTMSCISYSNNIQEAYPLEKIFLRENMDSDKYIYLEYTNYCEAKAGINVENYNTIVNTDFSIFYDENDNVWKNKYCEPTNYLDAVELIYEENNNQIVEAINIVDFLNDIKERVVYQNLAAKEWIGLGIWQADSVVTDYYSIGDIVNDEKKFVIEFAYFRYNKQLKQFSDIWIDGWFLKK